MAEETALAPSPRRFSFAHLLLIVPWVALVIDAWAPIRDNSFLWHIRAGELQTSAAQALTADPFSFTMHGEPWLTQSWLAELLYFWGETNWGLGFVPPMLLLATSVTFLGIGLIAYRRSQSVSGTAVVLILSTLLLISFLVPRPVIFSFALFVLVILALERPATRWAVPLLFWVWASTHGSFAIGLAYVGLSLIAEREWKWLPTAIVSGLVTLLTAHGLGVIAILTEFLAAGDALALLSEWRQPELLLGAPALITSAVKRRRPGLLHEHPVRRRAPLPGSSRPLDARRDMPAVRCERRACPLGCCRSGLAVKHGAEFLPAPGLFVRIRNGQGGDQLLRVVVLRIAHHLVAEPLLHHLALVEHAHPVGQDVHDGEVVADEQRREAEFRPGCP